jgi:hypothetical protein
MSTTENGITIPVKTGYTFGGYYTETDENGIQYIDENGKLTNLADDTNFTSAGTLYAKWFKNLQVTFDANGGKLTENEEQLDSISKTYTVGSTYGELPTPTMEGQTFDGWYAAKLDEVPEGYTRVEYVESNGNQYIDTGIVPGSDTKVEFDYALTSLDYQSENGWGSSGDQESFLWQFWPNSKNMGVSVSDNWTQIHVTTVGDLNRHKLILQSGSQIVDGEVVGTDTISNTATTEQTMYIGAMHVEWDSSPANYAYQKVYSAKIWNGSTLVRDYIPCVRNSDNIAGYYDTVSGIFIPSASSTDLIAGSTFEKITSATQMIADTEHTLYAKWNN